MQRRERCNSAARRSRVARKTAIVVTPLLFDAAREARVARSMRDAHNAARSDGTPRYCRSARAMFPMPVTDAMPLMLYA